MAVIAQQIHRMHFERTIDWAVNISYLHEFNPKLEFLYPDSYIYCRSVDLPTSDTVQVDDGLGILGSYKSVKEIPDVRIELFSDVDHIIETALINWNNSSFNPDNGQMPVPDNSFRGIFSPGRNVIINRISPIDMELVIKSLIPVSNLLRAEDSFIPLDRFEFRGIPSGSPRYIGTDTADIRVLELNLKVIEWKHVIN